jgi:DNA-binding CsgD family transcriptional regulator/tetratricopeptide (TPR) repeat protein
MVPEAAAGLFAGRHDELRRLRGLLAEVKAGRGGVALVEGEPGIGKTALLATALAGTAPRGYEVLWGTADELSHRLPLQVILEALRVEPRSPDPRRAAAARLLREERAAGLLASGDTMPAAIEGLSALVDQVCADSPVVLVIDDLQWADDASLLLWHRLARAVEQLPLVLLGTSRPVPRRTQLNRIRHAVEERGGLVLTLDPLDPEPVTELVAALVGAPPGEELRRLAQRASGNPLYVRETVEAVLRDNALTIVDGAAELVRGGYRAPSSLPHAVERRLTFLSAGSLDVLRTAALLGPEFTVTDLATISGKTPGELVGVVDEAVTAGVVADAGAGLAFRHPLIRQALYEAMPLALRTALHREAAQALSDAGAGVSQVAEQLLAAPGLVDGWLVRWLVETAPALSQRAPQVAVELLQRAVDRADPGDAHRGALACHLARALFRLGQNPEAMEYARRAVEPALDPDRLAEMRWIVAYVSLSGDAASALDAVDVALRDPSLPAVWRARFHALAGLVHGEGFGDLDASEAAEREALALGEETGDPFARAYALHTLSVILNYRGNSSAAVEHIARALDVIGADPDYAPLRILLLCNQMLALHHLDRIDEADAVLRLAHQLADRAGDVRVSWLNTIAAEHFFWTGRWDDALAELAGIAEPPDATSIRLVFHGLAAVIASHRNDRATAQQQLQQALDLPIASDGDRAGLGFVCAAQALDAERDGEPGRALAALRPLVEDAYSLVEQRHQILPDLVRLALAAGEDETARAAAAICAEEAALPGAPSGKAFSADRCRGLIEHDPELVLPAVEHYRAVGRRFELATAAEDAAAVLAQRGRFEEARRMLVEATEAYAGFGAEVDVRRADARLRAYGVRRNPTRPRRRERPEAGWDALTATELTVAHLVTRGLSNPDIADELLLSRRTVQTHVQHILTKLGAHSRIEIAREALRRQPLTST